jgi:hypothetical protein
MGAQGHRLMSYLLPDNNLVGINESRVIVDRCDVEHNTTQRWMLLPADGTGSVVSIDTRLVTVLSLDGRCLTGVPSQGGDITVAPCATTGSLKRRQQLWWLNRNSRTMTALVNNASSPPMALQINNTDWHSLSLEPLSVQNSAWGSYSITVHAFITSTDNLHTKRHGQYPLSD